MNQAVIDFMRSEIKKGLKQLPEDWQLLFKRMYSYPNGNLSVLPDLEKPIDKVVDDMPVEKLDWALSQVQKSIAKIQVNV